MIIEYIRYMLTTHTPEVLIEAYARAGEQLRLAPECLGYELTQCAEEPQSLILRIQWASADAHMQGFRRGAHFPRFWPRSGPSLGR